LPSDQLDSLFANEFRNGLDNLSHYDYTYPGDPVQKKAILVG